MRYSDQVCFTVNRTPLGWLGALASSVGIRRVILPQLREEDVRKVLYNEFVHLTEGSNDTLACFSKLLEQYFSGNRVSFSELKLDQSWMTEFQQKVFKYLSKVPYGNTVSYKDVAIAIGQPKAFRAVGGALKENLLPLVIPCHRVVAANGSLGGFTGAGLNIKRALIDLEKA